jgi:hypothetical protein
MWIALILEKESRRAAKSTLARIGLALSLEAVWSTIDFDLGLQE